MIPNAILVFNGKGGVLKTSLVANLAGLAALSGWKVLAVDLDPQGNLARDLGYVEDSDDGANLVAATGGKADLKPLSGIRPNLDVVAGGPKVNELIATMQHRAISGDLSGVDGLRKAIEPIAGNYDLIVMDSPPGEALLHAAATRVAHYILIPTQPDAASIDGLGRVGAIVSRERANNPHLEVLGVVLGPLSASATAIAREARAELNDLLGGGVHIFYTAIRDSRRSAVDCRNRGELAHEYENAYEAEKPKILANLRKKKGRDDEVAVQRFSAAAGSVAESYQNLANEILGRFAERQQDYTQRVAGGGGT